MRRWRLKKLLLLLRPSRSSDALVMLPLWIRKMPSGLFTKNGCASCAEADPAVGYRTCPMPAWPARGSTWAAETLLPDSQPAKAMLSNDPSAPGAGWKPSLAYANRHLFRIACRT